ncbi:MAG: hypothetical protein JXQ87_00145 [Bacteroidia bacterium]
MRYFAFFLLFGLLVVCSSCNRLRESCNTRSIYPDLVLQEIKSDGSIKQEAVFTLTEQYGDLLAYTWVGGDTLEESAYKEIYKRTYTIGHYIDSLAALGSIFELNLDQNYIAEDASQEPYIPETISHWYFVEFEDSTRKANDLVEAIIPIDSKTEAYIAAVSSIEGYDAYWYYNSEIAESSITETNNGYLLHITYNETYCDPQKIGEIDISVSRDGTVAIEKDYGITQEIKCSCD